MLASLPDECATLVWRFFDARTLCRVACVSRNVGPSGAALAPLWRRLAVEFVASEIHRIEVARLPSEYGLQRQNASRRLDVRGNATRRGLLIELREYNESGLDDELSLAVDTSFWRDWYKDFFLAVRRFDAANEAFDEAKTELQELKKQRSDLRELLQATKSKSQNEKQIRRMQMNCVRWLNRTHRRAAATTQARRAQTTALTKSEITDELQAVENAIQLQSKMIFTLRSHYQKSLHRLTSEVAKGKCVLADLGE